MVISASLHACGVVFPFAMPTSICRSIVTICSGLYLLIGMTRFSSKWILSHSTWYKFRRSHHPPRASAVRRPLLEKREKAHPLCSSSVICQPTLHLSALDVGHPPTRR